MDLSDLDLCLIHFTSAHMSQPPNGISIGSTVLPILQGCTMDGSSDLISSRRLVLSIGKGNFRPPQIDTLNRSQKNLSHVITSATPTAVPN